MQEHHSQQPVPLGLVRKHLAEHPPSQIALSRKVVSAAVTLVEDQVHDDENGAEQMSWWHSKRDPRCFVLAPGSHKPLRHGALRYQKRAGYLIGGQSAQGA